MTKDLFDRPLKQERICRRKLSTIPKPL